MIFTGVKRFIKREGPHPFNRCIKLSVWIVDWDIPTERRALFYYHLNKIKRRHELYGSMSSQSVMVLEEPSVAEAVYRLAARFGHANLYRAEKLR